MSRRKRISIAPESLANLEEITPEQDQNNRAARVLETEVQAESQEPAAKIEGDQLSQYIQDCVKLSQDNKITIRNAFGVQLIDYMVSLAKDKHEGNSTNFSLASMTLDASNKIYGHRVDAVHQDAFRLVSGLGVGIPDAPEELNQPAPGDAKKPRKRRARSTYVAEEGANTGNLEIDYEICGNDVLTTVHHNDGNALGRIMSYNLVPTETESVDIEGTNFWWDATPAVEDVPCNAEKLPSIPENLPLSTYLMEQDMDSMTTLDTTQFPADHARDTNEDLNNSVMFDPDAEPIPVAEPLPEPGYDLAPDTTGFVNTDDVEGISVLNPQLMFTFEHIENLKSQGLNFAGPTVFKLKRFNILGNETKNPNRNRKRTRVQLEPLAFNEENTWAPAEAAVEKAKKRGTAKFSRLLSSMTMDRWTSDSTTLTVEFTKSSFERLTQPFLLPTISVTCSKQAPAEDTGEGRLIDYDDDAGDRPPSPCADDFFSEVGHEGERDFDLDNLEGHDNEFDLPATQHADAEHGYDNLVCAPGIVAAKLAIAYTKAAKRFNVRQMKDSYWKVLTGAEETQAKVEAMVGEKTFSYLYTEVQPILSQMNRKSVTVPLAFVSMLLLCNEKHLTLRADSDTDFRVCQAPNPYK